MADLTQSVIDGIGAYQGIFTPDAMSASINDLNTKFNLNLTPEEIKAGLLRYANTSDGSYHEYPYGPIEIAKESIANVLRDRGISQNKIDLNFLQPAQEIAQGTAYPNADYTKYADALAPRTEEKSWARFQDGQVQLKNMDGTWTSYGSPPNRESTEYVKLAADNPEVNKLIEFARTNPTALNREQQVFLADPLAGMASFGQSGRWGPESNLFDNKFDAAQAGMYANSQFASALTPEELTAGQQFVQHESPAAQAARADDGGLLGSGLGKLALLAAAIYTGGSLGGLFGGLGEAAGAAGLEGLGAAGADILTGGLGAGAAESSAALGALGSGLTGVDVAGLGLYGTTPATAGILGSGLADTTLASLGLDAGALAGAAGTAGLASQVGSNAMDWTDLFSGLGDTTADLGSTVANATGDVTSQIAQLQSAVENGSMSLEDAMAQMQQINNVSSGGSWLDYLNSGAFPSEAAGAVANVGIPDWAKNLPDALKKVLFPSSGTGTGTGAGNTSTGNSWLDSLLKNGSGANGTGGFNLLGALLGGGLAALGGGSKQSGETTTTQTPWGPQQPYLLDAWNKAKAASEAGNPLQTQANSNYQSVLSGPTTNPMLGLDNPYLAKQIDYANSDVTRAMMPAMDQANKASGSFGNSGVADQYGKALTDAYSRNANDMRYKDYYAQQQLQKDAVGNTLGFTQGASAFNAAPSQDYAKTVGAMNYGSSRTEPYSTNKTLDILGGASLGSQIGKLWG